MILDWTGKIERDLENWRSYSYLLFERTED